MNSKVIIKFHRETANTIFTNMLLESAEMLISNLFI